MNLPGPSRVPTAITERTRARSQQEDTMVDPGRVSPRVAPVDEAEGGVESVDAADRSDEPDNSEESEA
jgi:hypothetical protein